MIKEVIIINKQMKEFEIEFNTFIKTLEEFLKSNNFTMAGVETHFPMGSNGVSMILNNKIIGDMSDSLCFNEFSKTYYLELSQYSNAIAFNETANIKIDTNLRRLYFEDYGVKIQFYK